VKLKPNKVQIITLKDDRDNVVTTKEGLEMMFVAFMVSCYIKQMQMFQDKQSYDLGC
jgi:hypothetical protein